MIVLNKYNLPNKIVDLVKSDEYEYKPNRYSATEILNSTREIILKRRYRDRLVIDVSDRVNMLFGTAFHSLMEEDKETNEIRIQHTIEGLATLSGRIDVFEDYTVGDYKTTTVYKVKTQDFSDWEMQGLIYAWLLRKNGKIATKMRFIAFIKDFSKGRREFEANYPESQIYVHEKNITSQDIVDIEKFIIAKLTEIENNLNTSDLELPMPLDHELWKSPNVYAAMKNGGKRALRLYDTHEEATQHAGCDYVDVRVGTYRKLEYDTELQQLWHIAGYPLDV